MYDLENFVKRAFFIFKDEEVQKKYYNIIHGNKARINIIEQYHLNGTNQIITTYLLNSLKTPSENDAVLEFIRLFHDNETIGYYTENGKSYECELSKNYSIGVAEDLSKQIGRPLINVSYKIISEKVIDKISGGFYNE